MKRLIAFAWLIWAIITPSHAMAGTPYSINWAMIEENPSCEHARLTNNGGGYFDVNNTPIPTYEKPGAFETLANGWESNLAEAGFDSVLLRIGANDFALSVENSSGDNSCVHSQNVVILAAPTLGIEKPLFAFRRDGVAFSGSTQLDLKLEEINPQLAKDIALLEEKIAQERKWLIENADKIEYLETRLDLLQQLETEVADLVKRPIDELTAEDLDEILKRYSSIIDDATREALKRVITDLKQNIEDLQKELASLMSNFGDQASAISDMLTGDARQTGFDPDDPSNYSLGANDLSWVEVPDISDVPGAWEAGNDPYATYADGIIAALSENVVNGVVVGRANFVAIVRAWRSNQAALEAAMLARVSVSLEETNAFLNAENKVTGYLQQFMDSAGWLHDSPAPPDVRAGVDGVLKTLYGPLAEQLQDRLNEWEASLNPPEASLFFDTLRAFSAAMQAGDEMAEEFRGTMKGIVHGASRIGIGFVPFVGPALDICEAVTGKEWCLPSGRQLTTGERVWSGLGFGVGKAVKAWSGIKTAAISTEGKAVAAGIVTFGDDFAKLLKLKQLPGWRGINYASHVDLGKLHEATSIYERQVLQMLVEKEGHQILAPSDVAAKLLLGIKNSGPGTDIACDMITVTKDNMLVLSEVKGIIGGKVDVKHAVDQIKNVVKKLTDKGLGNGVERVQIFVQKGSVSKFSADFTEEGGQLLYKSKPVTLTNQGWPGLIVQVVYL